MRELPSSIYPIAYQVSHDPESRPLAEKPVYKIIVRSARNINETAVDWNKALTFDIQFDDRMPHQNDTDYQLFLESFSIYVDESNHKHTMPLMLHAIGGRAVNQSDCSPSYAGAKSPAGRSDVIACVSGKGYSQYITRDMIGYPCDALGIFTNRQITLQIRDMFNLNLTADALGNRSSGTYGDWAAVLVLAPKK